MRNLLLALCLLGAAPQASPPTLFLEAEDFTPAGDGWKARKYGENYYVGTFANTFLSRKAFLGAPEQADRSTASIEVDVPAAGRYLALVRYEAAFRFETQFRLVVEQAGKTRLDRLYGARGNVKIWAFGKKLQKEVAWDWGATENIVWEGHDAAVELEAGRATLTLVADRQPEPAARRNVDLVMLTRDGEDVTRRIEKENYLPLDGLLTQAGDLFLRVHAAEAATVTVPNGTEHSPYWVHLRTWKPKSVSAKAGESSDWVEVGSLLDSLSDGQWALAVKGRATLEFGIPAADGKVEAIARFEDATGKIELAYDADTRRSKRIRKSEAVLHELVDFLKKQPVHGKPVERTLVLGFTFDPRPGDAAFTAAREEFLKLIGAPSLGSHEAYIDVRHLHGKALEAHCEKLKAEGKAEKIQVVSLGDEIGLAQPPAKDPAGFRAWLKEVNAPVGEVEKAELTADRAKPELYYYSRLYVHRYGIRAQKAITDVIRRHLPNAGIGANYSPHHAHVYLGDTHQWISLFREGGMTMPWGEDYIFQMPVASPQVNLLQIDQFRAGVRDDPSARIQMYVMPHWPGQIPSMWRRMWYGAIAHGTKVFNLFEFRPVQAAYTENHCSLPAMFQEVRRAVHELGTFEDIVQDGRVRPGVAGLWFSEAGDLWDDNRAPFGAGKRTLYLLVRRLQLPLDVVVEGDDLKGLKALYLADRHVSRAASKAIADWVNAGGRLFATAGAGMRDEFDRPNETLQGLLGVEEMKLEESPEIVLEKQDLPFARLLDTARGSGQKRPEFEAFGAISRVKATEARTPWAFGDGAPAVVQRERTLYCAFLPGLTAFRKSFPLRPVDRGHEGSMAQQLPGGDDTARLLLDPGLERPVECSEPLVENTVIESRHGVAIPLVNWSGRPVKGLKVTVRIGLPAKEVALASGGPVTRDGNVFTLDLDAADALILR